MRAIARIDDAGMEKSGEKMRRPAGAVANDDDVGIQRLQIAGVVL